MNVMAVVLAVAMILSGECGSIGAECEMAVAQTMVARIESDEFPDSLNGVMAAYHGRAAPTVTSIALALLLVTGDLKDGNGFYYTYSETDRYQMRWRKGDMVICDEHLFFCQHFSKQWPGWNR